MSARLEDAGDHLIVWNGNTDKRGALSPELYAVINEAFAQAQDPRIRAVILSSDGGFFCAGGDLNVLIERRSLTEQERRDMIEHLHDCVRAIRTSPVPVIAAVKGGAAGAGMSIALACDFIVAEEGAKFTASYVKAGLVPDGGLTASLARLLPRPLAMEICLLAKPVTAERLQSLGVVTNVVAKADVDATAQALVSYLAQGPRTAQGAIRALVSEAYSAQEAAQLDAERNAMAKASGGDEAAEGIAAFLEKRPPAFS